MKNLIYLLTISVLSFTSYSQEKRCKKIIKNGFKTVLYGEFKSVVNNDTIKLNEVKYECVHTAMYTKKVMYDKFGKWHKEIYSNSERHPILIWENIKLFANDSTKFTIATNGLESIETIYASILVFDENNNDLLAKSSPYRDKLVEYFGKLINNNSKKEDFYDIYWKTVNSNK